MRNVPDRCCSYSQSKIGTDSNRDQHESAFNPKQEGWLQRMVSFGGLLMNSISHKYDVWFTLADKNCAFRINWDCKIREKKLSIDQLQRRRCRECTKFIVYYFSR